MAVLDWRRGPKKGGDTLPAGPCVFAFHPYNPPELNCVVGELIEGLIVTAEGEDTGWIWSGVEWFLPLIEIAPPT